MDIMGIDNSENPYIFFERNLKDLKKAFGSYQWKISGLYGLGLKGIRNLAQEASKKEKLLLYFLQGHTICLKHNCISIQIPERIEGLSCEDIHINPNIDDLPVNARIIPESIREEYSDVYLSFPGSRRLKVKERLDIYFDMEVRLDIVPESFPLETLKKPVFINGQRSVFYQAARTLLENMDEIYVNDKLHFIIQKKAALENSSSLFVKDLKRYHVRNGNFMAWFAGSFSLQRDSQLEIFSELEYFWNSNGMPKMFGYENKIAQLRMNFGFFSDLESFDFIAKSLIKVLKRYLNVLCAFKKDDNEFFNLANYNFPEEWSRWDSLYCSLNCSLLRTCRKDGMANERIFEEYDQLCLTIKRIISGLKSLMGYVSSLSLREDHQNNVFFYDVLGKVVEDQLQSNPLEYTESPMPLIARYAKCLISGSVYGD